MIEITTNYIFDYIVEDWHKMNLEQLKKDAIKYADYEGVERIVLLMYTLKDRKFFISKLRYFEEQNVTRGDTIKVSLLCENSDQTIEESLISVFNEGPNLIISRLNNSIINGDDGLYAVKKRYIFSELSSAPIKDLVRSGCRLNKADTSLTYLIENQYHLIINNIENLYIDSESILKLVNGLSVNIDFSNVKKIYINNKDSKVIGMFESSLENLKELKDLDEAFKYLVYDMNNLVSAFKSAEVIDYSDYEFNLIKDGLRFIN